MVGEAERQVEARVSQGEAGARQGEGGGPFDAFHISYSHCGGGKPKVGRVVVTR